MPALEKLHRSIRPNHERQLWAVSDNDEVGSGQIAASCTFRREGREADIRCTCKLNGRVLRKQTLRVTTHFCRVASTAKVGGEPIMSPQL
jgi:acyl-coenzyme A thioesterase PaaI-like protein